MKNDLIKKIEESKIIAILRGVPEEKILPLAETLYDGGIRVLEITFSADKSTSDEKTAEYIALLSKHFEGRMYIGAGTVLSESQVVLTKNAGGMFIISPDTNIDVIKKTIELGMVSIPGALTPTEIQTAHTNGADFVKLFPVANLGTSYVKALKAPLSHIKLLAVGGIDENDMNDYIRAGVCGIGISTGIVNKELLEKNDYNGIRELAEKYTKNIL